MHKCVAKFRCECVTTNRGQYGKQHSVRMYPVCDEKGEYKSYSEATPWGELRLEGLNEATANAFVLGAIYDITMTQETVPTT
jgi:hypothetical protein